ncbi:hypothetical protein [Alkalihalobacillus sp. 1P02AB]|uniref:hypothetical protein n=1 Tax=Alkalihalobacillus sp. 1P02AB TaxID=3132260 RepID=UPI0039A5A0EF
MEEVLERILGFLPTRSTVWGAVTISILIWAVQYLNQIVYRVFELPWQKKKNQEMRKAALKE